MNSAYLKFLRYQTSASRIKFVSKKIFSVQNRKREQHHLILLIRISLGTKFELKLKILIFLDQICAKRVFQV